MTTEHETGARSTPVDCVVRMASAMRAASVPVSTEDTVDATRALGLIDLADRAVVRRLLRCTLQKSSAHAQAFDRTFDAVFLGPRRSADQPDVAPAGAERWAGPASELVEDLASALRDEDADRLELSAAEAVQRWSGVNEASLSAGHHTNRVLRALDLDQVLKSLLRQGSVENESDEVVGSNGVEARSQVLRLRELIDRLVREEIARHGSVLPDVRPEERERAGSGALEDRPFLLADPDELAAIQAAVRPLARRIAARLNRRRRRHGRDLDMRATLRQSMSSGGAPVNPVLRRRTPHRPELVVLCDVSGSMATFAPFALRLLHALQREFAHTRSWVFVDGIVEVTEILRQSSGHLDPDQLLRNRGLVSGDGRSNYARALRRFLDDDSAAVADRTTVLVVGDARSHGREPATAELGELARVARRLYWLNPEPRAEWDTDDSTIGAYERRCSRVFEVATLRQLENCVATIAA